MEISLSELSEVKGIGKKTLDRIKQHITDDEPEEVNENIKRLELNSVNQGDSFELMRGVEGNSLDAVITDPPYNLGFMGRSWDTIGTPKKFQEWNEKWAEIAYEKLKPGGYMIVFSGTKTYHRMVSGVEDAGFEVKDMIEWMYGTGFPKSYNISKGFDKQAGAERKVLSRNPNSRENCDKSNTIYESGTVGKTDFITKPATDKAKKWEGWGTALKPAHEPILLAQKPREGTYCDNIDKYEVGGLNIDGCRVEFKSQADIDYGFSGSETVNKSDSVVDSFGVDKFDKVDRNPHNNGRFPANLVLSHHPDCNDDCRESCPVRRMNEQSGVLESGKIKKHHNSSKLYGRNSYHESKTISKGERGFGDKGGAARYFNQFHFIDDDFFQYIPKASKSERTHDGQIENNHPTVKPIELMEWLIKLVVPEGGVMLDPFAGSGTTGVAAKKLDRDYILIEQEQKYIKIIEDRLKGGD
jgi:site-specific DNA-methyltransferase (adenine-specific)